MQECSWRQDIILLTTVSTVQKVFHVTHIEQSQKQKLFTFFLLDLLNLIWKINHDLVHYNKLVVWEAASVPQYKKHF